MMTTYKKLFFSGFLWWYHKSDCQIDLLRDTSSKNSLSEVCVMLSFKSSIKTAILVLSVLASSIDGQDCKTSFTLHQIESTVSVKSGPAALLSTYHKYNRRAPENIKSVAAVDHRTVIASPSDFDKDYLTPITIGGQTLNLLIDTGSDFLWVRPASYWF